MVQIRKHKIASAFEVPPRQLSGDLGIFLGWYRSDKLAEKVRHCLDLRQGNTSISKMGVVRGTYFADIPPSKTKYVTVTHGAVLDFVSDIRAGEHGLNPLDPDIGLDFQLDASELLLSPKDTDAPTLQEALALGRRPHTDDAAAFYSSLNSRG